MEKAGGFQDDKRPDPDALLKEIQLEEEKKGRLKIFLGYAPGVGKTYAMLQEAHVLKNRGEDVVVGIV
jgi:two-component system sensor histidine kinase KdpD